MRDLHLFTVTEAQPLRVKRLNVALAELYRNLSPLKLFNSELNQRIIASTSRVRPYIKVRHFEAMRIYLQLLFRTLIGEMAVRVEVVMELSESFNLVLSSAA